MSGHLFILGQKHILEGITQKKRVPISAKQWEAGADQIKKGDFIILVSGNKNGPLTLWMTAKAAVGTVKSAYGGGSACLSFIRVKNNSSSYTLAEGISTGSSLTELSWKKLDDQEVSACFFDTRLCDKALITMKNALSRTLPKGLGLDSESVLGSVILNGTSGSNNAVLREWHEANLLVDEAKYRQILQKRLSELDGNTFETLLTDFFKHSVFAFDEVHRTQKSNDRGIDLRLTRQDEVLGQVVVIVQCKRQSKTLSSSVVRELSAARNHAKASRGVLITTSHFSAEAVAVAKIDGHLELIDGDKLASLFFRHAEKVPGVWRLLRQSIQNELFKSG